MLLAKGKQVSPLVRNPGRKRDVKRVARESIIDWMGVVAERRRQERLIHDARLSRCRRQAEHGKTVLCERSSLVGTDHRYRSDDLHCREPAHGGATLRHAPSTDCKSDAQHRRRPSGTSATMTPVAKVSTVRNWS